MLNNLKIGVRLCLGFALLLLVLLATGLAGIWGVNSISSDVLGALETDAVIAQKATALEAASLTLRRYEKDAFLNIDNPKKRSGYVEKWQKAYDKFASQLNELEKVVYLAEEKQLVAGMKNAGTEYKQGLSSIFSKIDAGTITTPQAGNKAMGSYKKPIRAIGEQSEQLMLTSDKRLQAIKPRTAALQNQTANMIWILIATAVLVLALVSYFLTRSITAPVKQVAQMISTMEAGDLSVRIDQTRQDEFGTMTRTLNGFADSLQQEVVNPLRQLAQGDLSFNISPRGEKDVLRRSIKQVAADLQEIIVQIKASGNQIDSASNQVADSSQSLSQGATESAASLEEITSSMHEMASQTTQSAESANQANQLSTAAKTSAASGKQRMQAMIGAMDEINEAGQNIGKIIKVIDEIAFQTNLLALNAAVEAARAGQHGKGFAVVAEEVRNLAARSAKAAAETSELIEGSVEKTRNGSQIAEQTSEALEEIVGAITKVSDFVAEIAAASNEQAQGISQVNQGLEQIDQSIQRNTATAEESAAAAEELSSQATYMQTMLNRFKLNSAIEMPSAKGHPQPANTPAQHTADGWANMPDRKQQLAINLDDDEFGKF